MLGCIRLPWLSWWHWLYAEATRHLLPCCLQVRLQTLYHAVLYHTITIKDTLVVSILGAVLEIGKYPAWVKEIRQLIERKFEANGKFGKNEGIIAYSGLFFSEYGKEKR